MAQVGLLHVFSLRRLVAVTVQVAPPCLRPPLLSPSPSRSLSSLPLSLAHPPSRALSLPPFFAFSPFHSLSLSPFLSPSFLSSLPLSVPPALPPMSLLTSVCFSTWVRAPRVYRVKLWACRARQATAATAGLVGALDSFMYGRVSLYTTATRARARTLVSCGWSAGPASRACEPGGRGFAGAAERHRAGLSWECPHRAGSTDSRAGPADVVWRGRGRAHSV